MRLLTTLSGRQTFAEADIAGMIAFRHGNFLASAQTDLWCIARNAGGRSAHLTLQGQRRSVALSVLDTAPLGTGEVVQRATFALGGTISRSSLRCADKVVI